MSTQSLYKVFHWFFVIYPLFLLPLFLTQLWNGTIRPDALTGNPILLSGQMIFCGFFVLSEWRKEKKDIYLFSFLSAFFMLFFAFTRAAWLGVLSGLVVYFYGYFASRRKN